MSSDEENLIRGQMMSDYLDAKKTLVALESRAKALSVKLKDLSHEIEHFGFLGGDIDQRLSSFPTREEIKNLMSEIEKVRSQKQVAEDNLRQLGFEIK